MPTLAPPAAPDAVAATLWQVKLACRLALGLLWVLEGALPKLWLPTPEQAVVVARIFPPSLVPTGPLVTAIGVAQVVFGLWVLSGRAERTAALLSTLGVFVATVLLTLFVPEAWVHFYGGALKNAALLACGYAVWALAPLAPRKP